MNPFRAVFSLGCAFTAILLIGCISSEGTGGDDHAHMPVQILGPIDTTRHLISRTATIDTAKVVMQQSKNQNAKKNVKTAPRFKSKQDTLKASMTIKKRPASRGTLPLDRENNSGFTVQIGAFHGASNALQVQKMAKSRFAGQPVFSKYIETAKLYRVSIGKFENRDSAFAFLGEMRKRFPREYTPCWINFLPR